MPPAVIDVRGDPRAMGRAQGEACRDEILAAISAAGVLRRGRMPASLRPLIAGPVLGRGTGRSIVRHYPHLSERIQGLARGSGQSFESLMELFVRAAEGALPTLLCDPAAAAARAGESPLLVRPLAGGSDWRARRSRPEVGFASVELTLPWLATSLAGVNEAGLAVALAPSAPVAAPATTPPAQLLVQECLQRFRDVAGALDWCCKRPASGACALVLADAGGRAASVHVEGDERRVVQATEGVLAAGGFGERHPELRKSVASAESVADAGAELGSRIALSPGEGRLRIFSDDAPGGRELSVD